MKYKTDFKKYWKSEVDKYKSISVEIKRPERADLVKRLDVFMQDSIWWSQLMQVVPNLQPMQVAPPGGQNWNQC